MNYIALEGVDGAGKSTQIEALKAIYKDAVFTVEPGASALGEKIRDLVLNYKMSSRARALLFLADRAEHIEKVVKPNINRVIISDRSVISGVAYALDDSNGEMLKKLNIYATDGVLPTKVILLQMSLDLMRSRLDRELDLIESAGFEYLLKVQENIQKACKLLNIPLFVVDAGLAQDEITNKIKDQIDDNRS